MEIGDFLKSLAINAWYKAVLHLGGAVLVASFFLEVKGISNGQLQLLSGGAFLVGLGEWKNHKVASWFKPPNVYIGGPALLSATVREADPVGITLNAAGVILFALGVLSILRG